MLKKRLLGFISIIALVCGVGFVSADEGMWLLSNLPLKQLQEKYQFVPTAEWVERVQKSSARLPNCSSSFVSDIGLIMTNWHCAEETVKRLSTSRNNYYARGFYAMTYSQELRTNLTVRVLMSVEPRGIKKPGLLCEDVMLYQGGLYQSYCYKVYDDIRLVFAPEERAGFFGGDADNFEYPRSAFDVSFLRAYENGKPAHTPFHYKWSKSGASNKELIFVAGHPGRTARLLTSSALMTERDVRVPFLLDLFRRRELSVQQFMIRSEENRKTAESDLFSWQNSRKLYTGKIQGLQDYRLIQSKIDFENKVLNSLSGADKLEYEEGLRLVAEAQEQIRINFPRWILASRKLGLDSRIFGNDKAGLNIEYEEHKLRDSLTHLFEVWGYQKKVNGIPRNLSMVFGMMNWGQSPSEIANRLVRDPLAAKAFSEFVASESYAFTALMNDMFRQEAQGYEKISQVLFRLYGTDMYPDATFTLRLSYGTVSGYSENGNQIPSATTLGDAYRHALDFSGDKNHELPLNWVMRKRNINPDVPLNFVSDLDITGGNSGSPAFNKDLEIVGLIFDGNIQSLVSDYDYKYSPQSRAIAVHSAGILEVLSKIYRADRLVRELTRN